MSRVDRIMASFLFFMLFLAGCGGGGGSDPVNNGGGGTGVLKGIVYAPNGTDPIGNAVVYVPENPSKPEASKSSLQAPSNCDNPGVSFKAKSCTAADGSFTLDNLPSGNTNIVIAKGFFKKSITVNITESGIAELTREQSTLPNAGGSGAEIPRIAVVTGSFDKMENVLAKIGLGEADETGALKNGTEKFTLLDGDDSLPDGTYQNFRTILQSLVELKKYDLIVINCGTETEDLLAEPAVMSNLKQYLQDGGRIYATDLSYDYVEQVFPEFVDFFGDDAVAAPTTPEIPGSAEVGDSGITTNGDLLQPGLKAWLGTAVKCGSPGDPSNTQNCLNPDGTAHLEDFLSGWGVINGPHAGKETAVTVWVRGDVSFGGTSGVKPLTLTFPAGNGKMFYSSYHTESIPHPYFLPQERILQYLLFEIVE
jgi:hypothetical protein